LPCPPEAAQYGVDSTKWRALVDAIWPSATSVDGILLALSWCKWRGLDPIKRPCHIVPIYNAKLGRNVEGVWPSISELRITAFRTGQYAGIDEPELGPLVSKTFKGRPFKWVNGEKVYEDREVTMRFPEWARMTVYRIVGGAPRRFVGPKVYYEAAYGCVQDTDLPNEKWTEPGCYMLEKCSEAAALRRAFPEEMGDMHTAEEMEGRRYERTEMGGGMTIETPVQDRPRSDDPKYSDTASAADKVTDVDGADESGGWYAYDEVGAGIHFTDERKYIEKLASMFNAAPDEKTLRALYENNVDGMKMVTTELSRGAFKVYADAMQVRKAAEQARQKPPAGSGDGPRFPLRNVANKIIEPELDAGIFAIRVEQLFNEAEDIGALELVYRHNGETIKNLSNNLRTAVIEAYDRRYVSLRGGK
jgi:phage recombination protein Bet